jgi:hypothetical protein
MTLPDGPRRAGSDKLRAAATLDEKPETIDANAGRRDSFRVLSSILRGLLTRSIGVQNAAPVSSRSARRTALMRHREETAMLRDSHLFRRLKPHRRTGAGRLHVRRRPIVEPLEQRCLFAADFRSIDGTGNNLANPEWGSTGEQLLRIAPAEYADNISALAGADRPGAREISNAIVAHSDEATPNDRNLTAYIYIWGQFIDHDLDLTGAATPREAINVPVPAGDPVFDPDSTGTQTIPVSRSIFDPATGTGTDNPRQQINEITAWLDGSMIYGSDVDTAASLRTFSGGKLKTITSPTGDLPPIDNNGNYLGGDVRANENIELTSMHTLFVREHNRLAGQIAAANPTLTDDEIYQRARAIVIAELQVITYKEWLPALLGPGALSSYWGYNDDVNPGIANEFSSAVFRLHSTINDDVEFFDNDGRAITFEYLDEDGETIIIEGEVTLFEAFFNPTLFKYSGVDGILKYAASTHMEELDNQIVDSLRNFLFTLPSGGLDLASLNIQRGRDHGLADYNTVRVAYGLPAVDGFDDITSNREVQQTLEELYGNVDNIDLWVGAMAEDHVRGGSVGPLARRVIAEQFQRLRDADRFWYQRAFSGRELDRLERTTLADIIERNTGVEGLQDNVFFFRAAVTGEVYFDGNGDGDRDRRDFALPGIRVELLDDEGEVVASTRTDRNGRYRFTQFGETGDFQVRVVVPSFATVTTDNPQEFLVSTGDQTVNGPDFGVRLGRSRSDRSADELAMALTEGGTLR